MNRSHRSDPPLGMYPQQVQEDKPKQFDQLEASCLFCPTCKEAVPVRKRLLLVLPEGERYEYLCVNCSTSVGKKVEAAKEMPHFIYKP